MAGLRWLVGLLALTLAKPIVRNTIYISNKSTLIPCLHTLSFHIVALNKHEYRLRYAATSLLK